MLNKKINYQQNKLDFPFLKVKRLSLGQIRNFTNSPLFSRLDISKNNRITNPSQLFVFRKLNLISNLFRDRSLFQEKVFQVRTKTIMTDLIEGTTDLAILGADKIIENQLGQTVKKSNWIIPIFSLNFGFCDFYIQFPANSQSKPKNYSDLKRLLKKDKRKIATNLPLTLRYFLKKSGINLELKRIKYMSGSEEIAPYRYPNEVMASASIVSSGQTAKDNQMISCLKLTSFPGAYLVTSEKVLGKYDQ